MELRQYLQIARRWAWLLILGMVVGATIGYFSTSSETPVYRASTKIMVSRSPENTASDFAYLVDQNLAQTYIQLLTTQPVLAAVSEKLGYPVSAGQIATQLISDTSLIRLSVENIDPQRAADVANMLVQELIIQNEELQNTRYTSAEESLQAQLTQVEGQINALQGQISNLSEESLQAQQTEVKAEISNLEAQILQVQREINELAPTSSGRLATATYSPEEKAVLQEKQLRLDQLKSTLDFYQSIYLNLLGAGTAGIAKNTTGQLSQLQSALNLYQQIYSNLLSSYESIRLARLQNTPNVVQVEMAVPNTYPVRPQPMNTTMLGAVVGLMLAAGIVFLIEYLDDTIKSPKEITDLFNLKVIGYIAEMSKDMTGEGAVYVDLEPRSPITEAFRSLRTNIEFSNVDEQPKTIMVASANPSEGKTTVAVNLAMVFAQSGKKVVLVDADMRRPMVHRYLGLSNRIGLSDVILDSGATKGIERPWRDTGLSVITSGSLPPNPAELLSSRNMLRFIEYLNQEKHISVIDSPPFLVSDATLLAAKVDGVVLVVQPGKTRASALAASLEQLDRVNANVLGVVFNRIPRNKGYYYGGYQHEGNYYTKGRRGYYSNYKGNGSKPIWEKAKDAVLPPKGR
jgi:tyrosine-protein kinase